MLRLYRSLTQSKLEYGSVVYGSIYSSYLEMLDPVYNQGLRLCLGAFRTSPMESFMLRLIGERRLTSASLLTSASYSY